MLQFFICYTIFKGYTVYSLVQSLSRVQLFATPWIAARQASLSITNSRSSLRLTSIESVMPSSHLILSRPLLLLPPIPPSIRVFSNESTLHMRWPKYCLQLWQNIRCIPHVVQYILVACLAHNSLYLPLPTLRVPLSSHHWEPLICSLYLWVCFTFVLFMVLLFLLDSAYKWYHTVFVFFCLTYFT